MENFIFYVVLLSSDRIAGYLYILINMENDTSNQQQMGPKEQVQFKQQAQIIGHAAIHLRC